MADFQLHSFGFIVFISFVMEIFANNYSQASITVILPSEANSMLAYSTQYRNIPSQIENIATIMSNYDAAESVSLIYAPDTNRTLVADRDEDVSTYPYNTIMITDPIYYSDFVQTSMLTITPSEPQRSAEIYETSLDTTETQKIYLYSTIYLIDRLETRPVIEPSQTVRKPSSDALISSEITVDSVIKTTVDDYSAIAPSQSTAVSYFPDIKNDTTFTHSVILLDSTYVEASLTTDVHIRESEVISPSTEFKIKTVSSLATLIPRSDYSVLTYTSITPEISSKRGLTSSIITTPSTTIRAPVSREIPGWAIAVITVACVFLFVIISLILYIIYFLLKRGTYPLGEVYSSAERNYRRQHGYDNEIKYSNPAFSNDGGALRV